MKRIPGEHTYDFILLDNRPLMKLIMMRILVIEIYLVPLPLLEAMYHTI